MLSVGYINKITSYKTAPAPRNLKEVIEHDTLISPLVKLHQNLRMSLKSEKDIETLNNLSGIIKSTIENKYTLNKDNNMLIEKQISSEQGLKFFPFTLGVLK